MHYSDQNIPIGLTIEPGNINDQTHFKLTYRQLSGRLREGSLVIFDKGANSVANTAMIRADNLQYMTAKKLNKSDDMIIAQLFISLVRFEIPELKHTSTKFIKKSLSDLTVTVDLWMRKTKKYIHSNFDPINTMILRYNWTIS